jgi:hypothetical protein
MKPRRVYKPWLPTESLPPEDSPLVRAAGVIVVLAGLVFVLVLFGLSQP